MKRLITALLIPFLIAVPELAFAQRGVQAIVTQQASAATAPSVAGEWAVSAYDTVVTQTLSPTAGQLLVAFTTQGTTAILAPSGCGTWTQRGATDGGFDAMWSAPITSSGSCTVTLSLAPGDDILNLWNINTVSKTVDVAATAVTLTGTPITGASVTTTVANDLVVGTCTSYANTATFTIISPFINDFNGSSGAVTVGMAHYVNVSAGAIAPSWTVTTTQGWYCGTLAVEP